MHIKNIKIKDGNAFVEIDENFSGNVFRPSCIVGKYANEVIDSLHNNLQIQTHPILLYNEDYIVRLLNDFDEKPMIYLCNDLGSFLTIQEQYALFSKIKKHKNIGLIFSTKTPYLISDCKQEDVYIADELNELTHPDFQTWGSSFNEITMLLLKQTATVSKRVINELQKIKKSGNVGALKQLGDSLEKSLLLINIHREQEETRKKQKQQESL